MNILTPEVMKPIQMLNPVTTNGGQDSDWVSMKDINRLMIVCELTQAAGHATALTLNQATVVAGTDSKAITNNVEIWANEATGTSDTNVRQTAAKAFTVNNSISNKIITFVVEPSALDVANSFDCVSVNVADSSEATNFISITGIAYKKSQGPTPPSDITD